MAWRGLFHLSTLGMTSQQARVLRRQAPRASFSAATIDCVTIELSNKTCILIGNWQEPRTGIYIQVARGYKLQKFLFANVLGCHHHPPHPRLAWRSVLSSMHKLATCDLLHVPHKRTDQPKQDLTWSHGVSTWGSFALFQWA